MNTGPARDSQHGASANKVPREQPGVPVIRIGVTGHRPNGLTRADLPLLRQRAGACLDLIHRTAVVRHDLASDQTYRRAAPWLISPLAEGADRIVAEEALARGFELICPLPFPVAEYERDFIGEASLEQFRSLLQQATAVYELDGSRATPAEAEGSYAAAGEMVLADSDILIAIWNGMAAKGAGGTELVVQAAIGAGTPVIWIEAASPHATHLVIGDAGGAWTRSGLEHLPAVMTRNSPLE